jgi:hypothetical protein
MKPPREKEWYRTKGLMQLYKNDRLIREFKFHDAHRRRAVLKIWNSEVKPNGIDIYELIIKID